MSSGPRKLLVAAIGVATINYLTTACEKTPTSGNLPAPQHDTVPVAGNLPAPPPQDAAPEPPPPVPVAGNLPAPPPQDAGKPEDAGKPTAAADAGKPKGTKK